MGNTSGHTTGGHANEGGCVPTGSDGCVPTGSTGCNSADTADTNETLESKDSAPFLSRDFLKEHQAVVQHVPSGQSWDSDQDAMRTRQVSRAKALEKLNSPKKGGLFAFLRRRRTQGAEPGGKVKRIGLGETSDDVNGEGAKPSNDSNDEAGPSKRKTSILRASGDKRKTPPGPERKVTFMEPTASEESSGQAEHERWLRMPRPSPMSCPAPPREDGSVDDAQKCEPQWSDNSARAAPERQWSDINAHERWLQMPRLGPKPAAIKTEGDASKEVLPNAVGDTIEMGASTVAETTHPAELV